MAYVMIVDDDEDFATAAATVLSQAGHEVDIEGRITRVLDRMHDRRPDLVILDVMFPEDASAGFDLARSLRRDPSLQRVPVLMLTAVNTRFPLGFSSDDIDEEWMPVSRFLEKPVDLEHLRKEVGAMLTWSAPGEEEY